MPRPRGLPRAVVDTNLFVSAYISRGGLAVALLAVWRQGFFLLLMSEEQRAEIDDVLHRPVITVRYRLREQEVTDLFLLIDTLGRRVPLRRRLPVHVRDPKDDMILASALGGNADYLVTSDADLLVLAGHAALPRLRIVSAADFLDLLQPSSA